MAGQSYEYCWVRGAHPFRGYVGERDVAWLQQCNALGMDGWQLVYAQERDPQGPYYELPIYVGLFMRERQP